MTEQELNKRIAEILGSTKNEPGCGRCSGRQYRRTQCVRHSDHLLFLIQHSKYAPNMGYIMGDYSFAYVADWSRGKDLEVLKASIGRIHALAAELIAGIEGPEKELQKAPSHRQRKAGRTARRRRQDAPAR